MPPTAAADRAGQRALPGDRAQEPELLHVAAGGSEHLHEPALGQLKRDDISQAVGIQQPLPGREREQRAECRRCRRNQSSRLFDKSVIPLFSNVFVWPLTVIRQNVFSDNGTLGVSVTLSAAAV